MQLLALLPARLRWPTASQSARSRSRSSMCISSVFEQLQDVPRPARVFAIVAGMGTAVGLAESILKCEARATLAEVERVEHEIIAKLGHYITPGGQARRRSWRYLPPRSCKGRSDSPKVANLRTNLGCGCGNLIDLVGI